MRKKIIMLCMFCLPLFLGAQDDPQEVIASINTNLGIGQQFDLGTAGVEFLKVISDSRCPRQVTCIWPGEAKVLLGVTVNGEYFEKEVVVSGSGAEFLFGGLEMQVSHLRPYPETPEGIAPEEYCLRFSAVFPKED